MRSSGQGQGSLPGPLGVRLPAGAGKPSGSLTAKVCLGQKTNRSGPAAQRRLPRDPSKGLGRQAPPSGLGSERLPLPPVRDRALGRCQPGRASLNSKGPGWGSPPHPGSLLSFLCGGAAPRAPTLHSCASSPTPERGRVGAGASGGAPLKPAFLAQRWCPTAGRLGAPKGAIGRGGGRWRCWWWRSGGSRAWPGPPALQSRQGPAGEGDPGAPSLSPGRAPLTRGESLSGRPGRPGQSLGRRWVRAAEAMAAGAARGGRAGAGAGRACAPELRARRGDSGAGRRRCPGACAPAPGRLRSMNAVTAPRARPGSRGRACAAAVRPRRSPPRSLRMAPEDLTLPGWAPAGGGARC